MDAIASAIFIYFGEGGNGRCGLIITFMKYCKDCNNSSLAVAVGVES